MRNLSSGPYKELQPTRLHRDRLEQLCASTVRPVFRRELAPLPWVLRPMPKISLPPLIWSMLRDYQKARLYTFLSPDTDPLGVRFEECNA